MLEDACVIRADEPVRIDIYVADGKLQVMVYTGTETDLDQDPCGVYDGTLDKNVEWEA
jgi:hypothetical protein